LVFIPFFFVFFFLLVGKFWLNDCLWFFRFTRLILFVFSFLFFCFYLFCGIAFFYTFFLKRVLVDFYLFNLLGTDFSFSFIFDFVSLGFFCCVSFISRAVFLYRMFYIEGTIDSRRFYWLVFLFVMSMFFLVFSGNFF